MKRQTALALAAVFSLSVAGTALAAPANPFVDVPAKHWSYDSVNKLAQAGVISGYGDGTYKGDKTITRYEMATIVAKAMANADKADAETKKTIEALKAEYGTELANLGVRVDNLEKNASKVKFTGEIRERYDWQDDVDNNSMTRLRLNMEAKVADNVTFHGRYESESSFGNADSKNTAKLTQAYIAGEVGTVGYSFGRQPIWLGQGLIADISGNADGLLLSGGKDIKVTAGAFKKTASIYATATDLGLTKAEYADLAGGLENNFIAANIDAKLNKNLNLTLSYLKDTEGYAYKTTAAGLSYTGLKNFTISGEAAQNDSDVAKWANDDSKAKAWMGKIKYAGAKNDKTGSLGVWVGYRDADAGFDPSALTTLDGGIFSTDFSYADNVKGTEFGVEYTVFKNGILTFQYSDLETQDKVDRKNFFTHLVYTF